MRTEAHRPAGLTAAPRLPPPPPPRWQVLSVNGEFSSARSITPGATLALPGADGRMTTLAVEAVTKKTGGIVNPVTVSGTLLAAADGAPVLASAYPGAPSVAYVHIRIVASYVCIRLPTDAPTRNMKGARCWCASRSANPGVGPWRVTAQLLHLACCCAASRRAALHCTIRSPYPGKERSAFTLSRRTVRHPRKLQ